MKHWRGQERTGLYRWEKLLVMVCSQPWGARTAQVLWWHQVERLTQLVLQVCASIGLLCLGLGSCASPLECRAVRSGMTFNSSKLHCVGIFCFFCAGKANGFQLRSSAPYTVFLSDVGKNPNSAIGELTCTRNEPPEDKSAFPVEFIRLYIDGTALQVGEISTSSWWGSVQAAWLQLRLLLGINKV